MRNPQRFAWDSQNGHLFVADIGQNIVEEISQVTRAPISAEQVGRELRLISRQAVNLENPRGDSKMCTPSPNTARSIRCCSPHRR